MSLSNDGPSNGGAEALRVARRFWPADERRRMELERLIYAAEATATVKAARAEAGRSGGRSTAAKPKPRTGWTCPHCGSRNRLFRVCHECCTPREEPRPR